MTLSPPPARGQEEDTKGDEVAASAQREPASAAKKRLFPGRKVLKRTRRLIQENGTETVRIEYVIDPHKLQQEHQTEAEERKRKREHSGSPFGEAKKHRPAQITAEQNKSDGQEEKLQKQQSEEAAIRCAACGQTGHKRFELECPLYIGDEAQSSSNDGEDSDFEDDAISHRVKIKRQSK